MSVVVRSFAKLNLGLRIGARRADGFHELRTVYQTIALHDTLQLDLRPGTGIAIRCPDPRVPTDAANTCWRMAERALDALKARRRLILTLEKKLPVQAGLGGASSNAVATLLGLERALKKRLPAEERLRLAAEVGSDVPLFLVGGTVLGLGRGEDVYPLPDLPPLDCVLVTPEIGVSTPRAFADWDELTASDHSDRMYGFSRSVWAWLSGSATGVPTRGGDRAEAQLLDLVRAGIENDFERVVFPQHSELREVKRALVRAGASYASLSGSGSSLFGLFRTRAAAARAAKRLSADGLSAVATRTLPRAGYWKRLFG